MSFQTPKQRARVRIMQALYQWQLCDDDLANIRQSVLRQKGKVAITFFNQNLHGIIENFEQLTQDIQTHVKHDIKDIPNIDLSILYLASYELKQQQLSKNIIINEAIELSKKYGTEKSDKFINYLLETLSVMYEK